MCFSGNYNFIMVRHGIIHCPPALSEIFSFSNSHMSPFYHSRKACPPNAQNCRLCQCGERKNRLIIVRTLFTAFKNNLKVVSATFLLVCILSLKENTCKARKNVFYFTSKALFVLEKIKFQNFDIQISSRHQMPKHKTRNTFY